MMDAKVGANEVNFDGLVGPTHNYAGLAFGNIASTKNAELIANPKAAALQGLSKMHLLMQLGIPQAVLPPHARPNLKVLRSLGFYGNDIEVLNKAYKEAPHIFSACYSSSSMWTANCATVSPSSDSTEGRLHITPANLVTYFHRSQESEVNYHILKKIFKDEEKFTVYRKLIPSLQFSDEGAANHHRFCQAYHDPGWELFVYGRETFSRKNMSDFERHPTHFPARQSLEASQAIARRHFLSTERVFFAKQNPEAIDGGVFHNDVISVGNQNLFIYHELAFENTEKVINLIKEKLPFHLYLFKVSEKELSITEAVQSYLFNSQVVTLNDGSMAIIAPEEAREMESAHQVLNRLIEEENPIKSLHFVDCRQSMLNGGGPACLRLRVVLTPEEQQACLDSVFLNETLYQHLVKWVNQYYRDKMTPEDLLDPQLLEENRRALSELSSILGLGDIYSF